MQSVMCVANRKERENDSSQSILVDITDCKDIKSACNIADLFQKGNREFKHSVCVCCGKKDEKNILTLRNQYDNLVYCNSETLLAQVPMICANMCTCGWIGIDFVDVFSFFDKTSMGFYHQFVLSDMAVIGKKIADLKAKIKTENLQTGYSLRAFVHIDMTPTTSLEDINEIATSIEKVIKGEVIWNVHINDDESDNNLYVSMLYGEDKTEDEE